MAGSAHEATNEPSKKCANLQELHALLENRTENIIKAIESGNLPILAYITKAIRPILQQIQDDAETTKKLANMLTNIEKARQFIESCGNDECSKERKGWAEELQVIGMPVLCEENLKFRAYKHYQQVIASNKDEIHRLSSDVVKKRELLCTLIHKLENSNK